MSLLVIESDVKINSNLSYALVKNPQTQYDSGKPFKKSTKMQNIYGWFPTVKTGVHLDTNPNTFLVLGKKIIDKKSDNFEYLDYSGYSSPEYYLQLFNEMLRTALREHLPETDKESVKITFNLTDNITLKNNILADIQVLEEGFLGNKVVVSGATLHEAVNKAALYTYIQYMYSSEFYFEDVQYTKYLTLAVKYLKEDYNTLKRFVLACKALEKFTNICKPLLDTTDFVFNFGNNGYQRNLFILNNLAKNPTSENLYDLGCGEGSYFKPMSSVYTTVYGIEKDLDVYTDATHTVRKKELLNVQLFNKTIVEFLQESILDEPVDVLCTEVLEHMAYPDSVETLQYILNINQLKSCLITLPNKDFNRVYGLKDNETRHTDHYWEPTQEEAIGFIKSNIDLNKFSITEYFIGDSFKGIYSTLGFIIKAK